MSKLIIDNRSSVSDSKAVEWVHIHMLQKSSQLNDQNYVDTGIYYVHNLDKVVITHEKNRKSDRFIVTDGGNW